MHLILMGDGSPSRWLGVKAVPGRLPRLLRYPGESAEAFCNRALHHVEGSGVVIAPLIYASDPEERTQPPSVSGPTGSTTNTGRNDREISLAAEVSVRRTWNKTAEQRTL